MGSSKELAAIRAGFMAAALGPVTAVVAGALGTMFVAFSVDRVWPSTRRMGDLRHLRPAAGDSA